MAAYAIENDHGCGFIASIFQRRRPSLKSLPPTKFRDDVNGIKRAGSLPTPIRKRSLPRNQTQMRAVSEARRRSTGSNDPNPAKALIKAPSGNIMLLGQMEKPATGTAAAIVKVGGYHHSLTMGNIVRKSSYDKLDPEALKMIGNERYKEGKFEEALGLYDQAIALDSSKPSYRCNKSAALIGLGRLLEAVSESREALRMEPSYHRAHFRLASLYIRLGYPGKALYHFKHSGSLARSKDIADAEALEASISRCDEAEKSKNWTTLLKETRFLLTNTGADSAFQIYAQQVEALLNLHRHEEAYAAFRRAPSLDVHLHASLFGVESAIRLYSTQARVYIAAGRFDDAIKAAENAMKLNPRDKDVKELMLKTQAVQVARSHGNKLFKESKYSEACSAYGEGLEHEPYNSVLLCNRSACRSKLGQFEKSIEDCNLALSLWPSYCKARLRRADCSAKMERWEASIEDYEMLMREAKRDQEEIGRGLMEARLHLTKRRCLMSMEGPSTLLSLVAIQPKRGLGMHAPKPKYIISK